MLGILEIDLYHRLLAAQLAMAAAAWMALRFVTAPYGRHSRTGWGPVLPSRVAWPLMEGVAPVGFAVVFFWGARALDPVPLAFLLLWEAHYVHRAFVYPLRTYRPGERPFPVVLMLMGLGFNALNAYLQARWLTEFGPPLGPSWMADPRFLAGLVAYLVGSAINRRSDAELRRLRRQDAGRYAIPRGGLHERISCPNYFGEIVQWIGWAVATWSPAGLCFAIFTYANLAPRAEAHHRWYRSRFPDYPTRRRALFPF